MRTQFKISRRGTARIYAENKCDLDINDMDNTIYPGAPEICDGKDNNLDGIADNIGTPCQSVDDCAQVNTTKNPGVVMVCKPAGKCEASMRTTICFGAGAPDPCPCNSMPLVCANGSFPTVPEFCR